MAVKQDEDITRAKILETIDRLFYRQGIRAVGVDTIVAELGISKKTLYRYFRSKSEMIEAYLRGRFRPLPVDSDKPPAEQILSNFAWLERSLSSKKEYRGCAYLNALAELGDDEREFKGPCRIFQGEPQAMVSRPSFETRRGRSRHARDPAFAARRRRIFGHAYQKGPVVDAGRDCRCSRPFEKCRREPQLHPAVRYRRSDSTPGPSPKVETSTYSIEAQRVRASPGGALTFAQRW